MKYGYFDDKNREYVIDNPKTPVKWINYVGTLAFGGFVDQTGGALICKGDPALNRIVKYIPQLPDADFKGTTLYLRLREAGRYKVFSPYFVPTLDSYDRYECRVGLGYTRIVSEFYGVRTDVTIFVPPGQSRLVRDIKITNLRDDPVEVDVIPVVEYTHFDALKQFSNADWVPQTMQSALYLDVDGKKILTQCAFMKQETNVNYFTSNQPIFSFESDRRRFLGDNGYGSWANPLSLQQAELSNTEALRGDNIGALMHHLGRLAPGATKRLVTQLGQAASIEAELPLIRKYDDFGAVDAAFEQLNRFWDAYLSHLRVDTPDARLDSMLNIHNPRQCHTTKNWSRYLSLYQLGLGLRGVGFRDSAQDVLGILPQIPEEGRALIVQLLHVQKRDGSAMHQLNPLTMEGSVGEAHDPELPGYYSDDHLWSVLAICEYLKETGDFDFLDETVPYYEKNALEKPIESGTVLDHMLRGIEFTRGNVGEHGLPLAGFADWNDTVNLASGAESLFTANLYGKALRELVALAAHLGDLTLEEKFAGYYAEMKQRVNLHGWDGGWYVRYFDAEGKPIGSRLNETGQVYANAQSWPVISGFAPEERARAALDVVYERLNTSKGIKLSTPGYDAFDPKIGGVSTYPPGAKENGGIFLHANPWVIMAEVLVGGGKRAYEYYSQVNPATKNDQIDEFECEPYVYPQNILGDEHPQFGLARNSWLTGTASWMYKVGTQYILGVRPTYAGLEIDPCIPKAWEGFTVTRRFRGATYNIQVKNPNRVNKGIKSVLVDDELIDDNLIPPFEDRQTHEVEVILG